jgi:hypothetical protein
MLVFIGPAHSPTLFASGTKPLHLRLWEVSLVRSHLNDLVHPPPRASREGAASREGGASRRGHPSQSTFLLRWLDPQGILLLAWQDQDRSTPPPLASSTGYPPPRAAR